MENTDYPITKEEKEGRTYLVARKIPVNLENGIIGRPSYWLSRECLQYPNQIYLFDGTKKISTKDFPGILALNAIKGDVLDVLVEDLEGTEPERIIRRLCSGLTTRSFCPNFDD